MNVPTPSSPLSLLVGLATIVGACAPRAVVEPTPDPPGQIEAASGRTLAVAEVDQFVADQMAALGVPGLSIAVVNDGRVVYHRALGAAEVGTDRPVTEASVFEAASLSKPVFAYFVLRLVDEGTLDLDVPLHTYLPFPELADDRRYERVTARMVLDHTTGFPNWRWFDPAPDSSGIERGTMYVKADPGTFTYSGEAYHYLARVVAHLTGTDLSTLDDLMDREVAAPLGIDDFFWTWDDDLAERKVAGHEEGRSVGRRWPRSFPDDDSTRVGVAGRLHTEALGYARFLVALMDGEGLSPASRDAMLSPQSRVPEGSYDYEHNGLRSWGLGVGMGPTPYGTCYEHGGNNGGFQSGFAFFRDRRVGYVLMTNGDRGAELNDRVRAFLTEGEWPPSGTH